VKSLPRFSAVLLGAVIGLLSGLTGVTYAPRLAVCGKAQLPRIDSELWASSKSPGNFYGGKASEEEASLLVTGQDTEVLQIQEGHAQKVRFSRAPAREWNPRSSLITNRGRPAGSAADRSLFLSGDRKCTTTILAPHTGARYWIRTALSPPGYTPLHPETLQRIGGP
jgi:hypothetical protein